MNDMESNPAKSFYKIGEASAMLDVPVSTLRFWESMFPQLTPEHTEKGHRRYTAENVEVCRRIKHLLRDKGLSIEYAQKEMNNYRKCQPRRVPSCKNSSDALRLLFEAKSRCDDAHAVVRIEAVEGWIKQTDSQS